MNKRLICNGEVVFNGLLYDNKTLKSMIEKIKEDIFFSSMLKKQSVIAIYLNRGAELLASICALFELNIPFLLLDSKIPIDRLEYMINTARVDIVISTSDIDTKNMERIVINIDSKKTIERIIPTTNKPVFDIDEIAYVIFTSGTTGNPKAVQVRKRGLINFIESVPKLTSINSKTVIGSFTDVTFDIFILESLVALYSGARVVIGDENTCNNVKALIKCIEENSINMLQFTPSRLRMIHMIDPVFNSFKNINVLLVGGEHFPEELLQLLQQNTKATIYNMYGPTETTIWSTVSNLTYEQGVDIGKPIKNTDIYLLDLMSTEQHIICGVDRVGEICIAGDGLALGYIENDEQTNKAFIYLNICNEQIRVYRTGDLGKYREDGKLVCLGRVDNQIKYNGHRIELEEIEVNINKIEGVINCAVCYSEELNTICAFVLKDKFAHIITKDEIRVELLKVLPDYMCPSQIVFIDEMIYTSSGKVDRKSLVSKYFENVKEYLIDEADKKNIDEQVVNIIIGITRETNINISTKLDGLVNSMQFVSIIVELEDSYNVEFEDDKLSMREFNTIYDICSYLKSIL